MEGANGPTHDTCIMLLIPRDETVTAVPKFRHGQNDHLVEFGMRQW